MDAVQSEPSLICDLEARQEEILRQLDELDHRIQKTLAEWQNYHILPESQSDDADQRENPRLSGGEICSLPSTPDAAALPKPLPRAA
jgi:hypothetical protein